VLGAGEPVDLGEDRDRGEGDDRPHAGDCLEPLHDVAPLLRLRTEREIQRPHPLRGLAPDRIVMTDMVLEVSGNVTGGEQALPVGIGPHAAAARTVAPGPPQEPLHGVHLGDLNPDEVPAA